MAKFSVEVEIQGFKMKIEGNREDASLIGRNIGDQLSGILGPGMKIVDGKANSPPALAPASASQDQQRKARRRSSSGSGAKETAPTIEFRHDPAKWGMPNQQWKTAQKALWLLYVVREVTSVAELSTAQIVKTFNTHFRQAKTVTNSNVSRDLGKLKIASPAPVGEDTTKTPPVWYLTDDGTARARALVSESLGLQPNT